MMARYYCTVSDRTSHVETGLLSAAGARPTTTRPPPPDGFTSVIPVESEEEDIQGGPEINSNKC
jgi:hypothetical protein